MQELQGWRDHTVKATETRAGERAVARLIELGGTDVQRYCGPQRVATHLLLKLACGHAYARSEASLYWILVTV